MLIEDCMDLDQLFELLLWLVRGRRLAFVALLNVMRAMDCFVPFLHSDMLRV